jgi:hypothetical protein
MADEGPPSRFVVLTPRELAVDDEGEDVSGAFEGRLADAKQKSVPFSTKFASD